MAVPGILLGIALLHAPAGCLAVPAAIQSPPACKTSQMCKSFSMPAVPALGHAWLPWPKTLGTPRQACRATLGDSRAQGQGLCPHSSGGCRSLSLSSCGDISHTHSRDVHPHPPQPQSASKGGEGQGSVWHPGDTGGCEMPRRGSGSPGCPSPGPALCSGAARWGLRAHTELLYSLRREKYHPAQARGMISSPPRLSPSPSPHSC